jgi:hypothetical protein
MFKIIAVAVVGILVRIGFFDLGQEAYTLAAVLLGIGALLDYSQRGRQRPPSAQGSGLSRGTVVSAPAAAIRPTARHADFETCQAAETSRGKS